MISSEKNSAGPTSMAASVSTCSRGAPGAARSKCLCAFSIITIAASIIAPTAIAMPPRLMMLELMPSACMAMNDISTPSGSVRMATKALLRCNRENDADQGDDDAFHEQRAFQRLDRPLDQLGAVVDRLDADVLGQAGRDLRDLGLDVGDHVQRVLAVALQRDAAHHLAFAVQLG